MRPYRTSNIEQSATIKAITGIDPEISYDNNGLATFSFPSYSEVSHVIVKYEDGIMVDARKLLNVRNQLFRKVKGGWI